MLYELNLQIWFRLISFFKFILWFRRLVADLSKPKHSFDARSIHLWFVVDKMAFLQFFIRILRFYFVNIIPPILHTHLNLHAAPTGRTNGRRLGTFRKSDHFEHRSTWTFLFFKGLFSIIHPSMCITLHKRVTLKSGVALSAHYAKHSWLRRILQLYTTWRANGLCRSTRI